MYARGTIWTRSTRFCFHNCTVTRITRAETGRVQHGTSPKQVVCVRARVPSLLHNPPGCMWSGGVRIHSPPILPSPFWSPWLPLHPPLPPSSAWISSLWMLKTSNSHQEEKTLQNHAACSLATAEWLMARVLSSTSFSSFPASLWQSQVCASHLLPWHPGRGTTPSPRRQVDAPAQLLTQLKNKEINTDIRYFFGCTMFFLCISNNNKKRK